MAKEKNVKLSVKTVFAGERTKEQVFYDLLLRKRNAHNLDLMPQMRYNGGKVFPAYTQPKGENCRE